MQLYNWDTIQEEPLSPLISRRVIHSERMTVCKIRLKKGAVVPRHSHDNEQLSVVESGVLKFVFDDHEHVARTGDVVPIPPNAAHRVDALEDSVAMDLFAPVREDWVRGDDAYLRK